jgi:membrane associated rhomboid family serine protease
MEEKQEATGDRTSPTRAREIRDGSIDFRLYSSEQLNELRYALDQETFPRNYANLLSELQRRTVPAEAAASVETDGDAPSNEGARAPVTIRFTAHDGLRGWLEAKSRRLSLYGEGFIETRSQEIVLGGWRRNWLGVAHRTEIFVPLQSISDVLQGDGTPGASRRESDWVRFRYEISLERYRFVEFRAASSEHAAALVEALPKARSSSYDRWAQVREFDTRLREAGARPWITPTIVAANLLVFAATALMLKSTNLMNSPQIMGWGANFAPWTLHGQCWRLLTALFLHGNLAHVGFNMWALWNVGRMTERLYGNWAYALLYFACGLLAGLASIAWDPTRPTLGASGAIFGIFAAYIVFALHPRSRAAVKVPATLWISTLVFALYSLVEGFFAPGIDNAAHVGGALSGLALGMCLARPLTPEARRRFPAANLTAAALVTAVGVVAALWQVTGLGSQLTGPERFLRTHQWYVNGQAENLRNWYQLAAAARSGRLSDQATRERVERELVPFWETATDRLKKEVPTLPADERQYGSLVADYSRLRLEWARAIVDAATGDGDRAADATQYEKDSNLVVARSERLVLLASLDHRPRALASSPWIVAVADWFRGGHWKCVEGLTTSSAAVSTTDSPTDGPAMRHAAACRAQTLFVSADYAALDRWLAQSAGSIGDLPDGGSTLDGIVRGLGDLFDYGSLEVVPTLGRTADWQRQIPDSVYPRLLQTLIFQSWAWAARGHGYADSISPEAWAAFAQRTEMAAMGLREIVERANKNPLWYQLSLNVGLDQSTPVVELRSTFDRGITEQSDYWPLYQAMLRIVMPRWHGSYEDVHGLIQDVSQRYIAMGKTDYAKYAQLYWTYSALENDSAPLFDGALAAWSTMKAGFGDLRREHPSSDFILNEYAKFACMAKDDASYAEVRPQLNGRLSSAAWSQKVSLKVCDERFRGGK